MITDHLLRFKAHLHFVRISQFAVRMRFPNSEFDTHFKSCSDEFNCYKKPDEYDIACTPVGEERRDY